MLNIMLTLFHLLISYELMHVIFFAIASHRVLQCDEDMPNNYKNQ